MKINGFIISLALAATGTAFAKDTLKISTDVISQLEKLVKEEKDLAASMQNRFEKLDRQVHTLLAENLVNCSPAPAKKQKLTPVALSTETKSFAAAEKRAGVTNNKRYRVEFEFPAFAYKEISVNVSDHDRTVHVVGTRQDSIAKKAHGFEESFYHQRSRIAQEQLPDNVAVKSGFSKRIENGLVILEFHLSPEAEETLALADKIAKQNPPHVVSQVKVVQTYSPAAGEKNIGHAIRT